MRPIDVAVAGRAANGSEVPALDPPFALHGVRYAVAEVEFDDAFVVPFLAERGLRPRPKMRGGVSIYEAPLGWGIAPYSAAQVWVHVEGYDSTDGTPGRLLISAFYSPSAFPSLRQLRGEAVLEGDGRQTIDGDVVTATGGNDAARLRVAMRRSGGDPQPTSGVHFYIHSLPGGEIQLDHCSWAGTRTPTEPIHVAIDAPGHPRLGGLRIRNVIEARWLDISLTIGAPIRLGGGEVFRTSEPDLIYMLSRFSRGAVLIDSEGAVLFANAAAEAMLAEVAGQGAVRSRARSTVQRRVDEILHGAAGAAEFGPLALPRLDGAKPYLANCSLLDPRPRDIGRVRRLLLITDPAAAADTGAFEAMRVLGLTGAEARVAVLVGSGLAPREAARVVGNTENTIRVTLQRVYEKLEIGRQSELAAMVARVGQMRL